MTGIIIAVLFILFSAFIFCIAPGKVSPGTFEDYLYRFYAHRGLFSEGQEVPENSIPAFNAAVQQNYGIELDVQLTKDEKVVVFHDDTLLRACGNLNRVDYFTYEDLVSNFSLFDTKEKIPLFDNVLDAVDSRVPLIIELKSCKKWKLLCRKTFDILKEYSGLYCIESFDPRIVGWFRVHAPEIFRGILSEPACYSKKYLNCFMAFALSRVLTNYLARPQFVSYRISKKPISVKICEKLGAVRIGWTFKPGMDVFSAVGEYDAVIFEHACLPVSYDELHKTAEYK